MPLPGQGPAIAPPAAENISNGSTTALLSGGIWLFDVINDPLEHNDLFQTMPDVVARLEGALAVYTSRGVVQKLCQVDPASSPSRYFNGTWTPWRGSRTPTCNAGGDDDVCIPPHPPAPPAPPGPPAPPTPPRPGPGDGSFDGIKINAGGGCTASGWCSGPSFSGPPLQVQFLLDGVVVANNTQTCHGLLQVRMDSNYQWGATKCWKERIE